MKYFESAGPADRFRIYLNDHRGLLAAEQGLASRSLSSNEGTDLGHLLQAVVDQNAADQVVVDQLLERSEGSQNPLKRMLAIIGERAGRMKMNGQLTGYSPLSRVIEVEALLASTAIRREMWNAVAAMGIDDDVTADAALRSENAEHQHARLRDQHVLAALRAFEAKS